eukprot:CAMPEP_0113646434 /NCGR_PEP_ID=MMETSP0017_2-20120614/24527_1 /TAXON_ID=2856 /ORGANISM="Cylindrotheca closterium" /LENGTH=70 /DNA_ID=CAMNT_0000558327 /DNA_START=632 /DNA_END=844 /DNA_ORIENTATION=- /assembly_acc=CAM_ASM_000147
MASFFYFAPVYETRGLAFAIGVHAGWNIIVTYSYGVFPLLAAVFVPPWATKKVQREGVASLFRIPYPPKS